MKSIHLSGTVDCRVFEEFVYHYQADELAGPDRDMLQAHLDACDACARLLEVETSFLRGLKGRLKADSAPAGLEGRIRSALEGEAPTLGAAASRWIRQPAIPALAAAVLLVGLLVPALGTAPGSGFTQGSKTIRVVRAVTIVDGDCDAAGHGVAAQKSCRDARHLNVLKVADGMYWHVNLDHPAARHIVFDPMQRGRRVVVEATLYPALQTVHLIRVRDPAPAEI